MPRLGKTSLFAVGCFASLTGGLVVAFMWLAIRSRKQAQRSDDPVPMTRDEEKYRESEHRQKCEETKDDEKDEDCVKDEEEQLPISSEAMQMEEEEQQVHYLTQIDEAGQEYEETKDEQEDEDCVENQELFTQGKDEDYVENQELLTENEGEDDDGQEYEETKDEQQDEDCVENQEVLTETEDEDDILFLQRHVPFLTRKQLRGLGAGRLLGAGGQGSVRLVMYCGTEAVVKEPLDEALGETILREARSMAKLDGAGGAPRLLAVCQAPVVLVQEFVGQTYDKYLGACSVKGFLQSLVSISHRLGEVHAKGIIHLDLKCNNITFTGTVSEPVFHIIDFGLAARAGQVVVAPNRSGTDVNHSDKDLDSEYSEEVPWMAPEVLGGRPLLPPADVYSFGYLVDCLLEDCPQAFLAVPLRSLAVQCTVWMPTERPSLPQVALIISSLIEDLTPEQLSEKFAYVFEDEEEE